MTCKTADGTKDAAGNTVGDGSKVWRNSDGYILSGPEYYSLFDGATGTLLDTVEYAFPRGTVSQWGDKYGNRVDTSSARSPISTAFIRVRCPSADTIPE